jgi:uncharacterized protein
MSQNAKQKSNVTIYQEERESVTLQNHGQKIFCVFHKPLHLKNYPAILFCHGLGGHKVGHYRIYVELANLLSSKGIATLRMDFRGSGDSEGDFAAMTLEGEVSDACVGLSFLENHSGVDSSRIALFGRSMGGAVAVMAANKYKKAKSICLWAPIYNANDWQDKWKRLHSEDLDSSHKQQLMTIEGQTPGYEFYKQLFSMNLDKDIANLSALPMMIIHGNQDHMVKPDHSEQILKNRLHASGKTKFIQLPNSDHHFSDLDEREIAVAETCAWYEETL